MIGGRAALKEVPVSGNSPAVQVLVAESLPDDSLLVWVVITDAGADSLAWVVGHSAEGTTFQPISTTMRAHRDTGDGLQNLFS